IEALGEAFALGRKYGIAPADLLDIVNGRLFRSPIYENYGKLIADQRYEPAGFKLKYGLKDVRLALAAADDVAAPTPRGGLVRPTTAPRRLTFQTAFAGVSTDGQSCVWEGSVRGWTRSGVRVELRQVESASEAASPVWHVVTHWSVVDPSGARSFDAELEGM